MTEPGRGTIAEQWAGFEAAVLAGAPEIQRLEMRKAFYAGFYAAFRSVVLNANDECTEEELAVRFNALQTEIKNYLAKLQVELADEILMKL